MGKLARGKRRFTEPFLGLRRSFLHCDAWTRLTTQARAVYIQLAARYNGSNNGRISFSAREAARECRISKNTATRAFKELGATGFIEVEVLGTFSQRTCHASEYLLTEYRDDIRQEAPKRTFQIKKKTPVPK